MKLKLPLWGVALVTIIALGWAMKSVASWRPQLLGVQKDAIYCRLSPDGRWLSVVSQPNTTQMWDVNTRRSLWKRTGQPVAFSPDGQMVVLRNGTDYGTREDNHFLKDVPFDLLTTKTGAKVHSLADTKGIFNEKFLSLIMDSKFSPDGRQFRLATQRHLWRWDVKSGRLLSVKRWKGNDLSTLLLFFEERTKQPIKPIRLIGGNSKIAPDTFSFYNRQWSRSLNQKSFRFFRTIDSKPLWTCNGDPTFSPDGQRVYVPSTSGATDVFNAHTGDKLRTISGPYAQSTAPSPDGNWLYEARDDKIYRWRAR